MLGNFEPKKITLDSVLLRCLWTKMHAVTPFECARSITRYKQKRMQWRHLSVRIALLDINKNACSDAIWVCA